MMIEPNHLVPGRECGSCTACCKDLAIRADGIGKQAGEPCRHLLTEARACAIGKMAEREGFEPSKSC